MSQQWFRRIILTVAIAAFAYVAFRDFFGPKPPRSAQDIKDSVDLAQSRSRELAALSRADSLEHSAGRLRAQFDSLAARNTILETRDLESIKRMKAIEGMFKNMTTNELRDRMIEEYIKAHQKPEIKPD